MGKGLEKRKVRVRERRGEGEKGKRNEGGKDEYMYHITTPPNVDQPTSGVSAGQIIPQCVLCSCLGLASLPSLPMGEFSLRR